MTNTDFDAATTVLDDIAGDYTIDPAHTRLGFSARHAMVATVRGSFQEFTGTAHIYIHHPGQLEGRAQHRRRTASPPATSSATATCSRGHFFETEQHPNVTFTSTDVSRDGSEWTITGDLDIKGVSHSVTIPFEFAGSAQDPFGNIRIGFEGETQIKRNYWGMNSNAALENRGDLSPTRSSSSSTSSRSRTIYQFPVGLVHRRAAGVRTDVPVRRCAPGRPGPPPQRRRRARRCG